MANRPMASVRVPPQYLVELEQMLNYYYEKEEDAKRKLRIVAMIQAFCFGEF